jgi:hypothetical protein
LNSSKFHGGLKLHVIIEVRNYVSLCYSGLLNWSLVWPLSQVVESSRHRVSATKNVLLNWIVVYSYFKYQSHNHNIKRKEKKNKNLLFVHNTKSLNNLFNNLRTCFIFNLIIFNWFISIIEIAFNYFVKSKNVHCQYFFTVFKNSLHQSWKCSWSVLFWLKHFLKLPLYVRAYLYGLKKTENEKDKDFGKEFYDTLRYLFQFSSCLHLDWIKEGQQEVNCTPSK